MAALIFMRNLPSTEHMLLPQLLQYFLRNPQKNHLPVCFSCRRHHSHFPVYPRISSNSTLFSRQYVLMSGRFASTQPAEKQVSDEGDSLNSKRSSSSSTVDTPDQTIVAAEINREYFKEMAQKAKSASSTGDKWNKFVDPDQPLPSGGAPVRTQHPDDRFGESFSNPLMYPKKPRKTTLTRSSTHEEEEEFDDVDWKAVEAADPEKRPFEPIPESDPALMDVKPALQPFSHNLAAYANVSENVQKLVDMGVEVWKLDKDPAISQLLMTAEWDVKIQPWIDWMREMGLTNYDINLVMGRHPRIFKESIRDLQTRVAYFESKKFPRDAIGQIIVRAPQTFSWNVRYTDKRLGELQRFFRLTGEEMREIIVKQPKLIVLPSHHWNVMRLSLVNELGFSGEEVKKMLLEKPKIFRQEKGSVVDRFDYLHNVCHFTHLQVVQYPEALVVRKFRVKQRHLFLKSLKRNQYDPERPGYVSLQALVSGRDPEFCTNVAKMPVEVFNEFIKTL